MSRAGSAPPDDPHADGSRDLETLVRRTQELIRIPSVVPVPHGGDGELRAARLIVAELADAGVPAEVLEPAPGRGCVTATLRGSDPGLPALVLLSHLDVVPVTAGWTRDPFGGERDGDWIWGRGAVDMKAMVAMEVGVLTRLAAEARAAGRDPACDPIPGLRRDVRLLAVCDEEAGGGHGAGWIAAHRPELLRGAVAINECGGVAYALPGGRALYPVQVAEKGVAIHRITVTGEGGHGSMPRERNAVLLAAEVARRLGVPGPPRLVPTVERFLAEAAAQLPRRAARLLPRIAVDPEAEAAVARLVDPATARFLRAIIRDTVSPNVIHAGIKGNVIPAMAHITVDSRLLPGGTVATSRADLWERIGPDLAGACTIELEWYGPPVDGSPQHPLYDVIRQVVPEHDPRGAVVPMLAPFSTDATHAASVGTPTIGFSPMRPPPGESFIDRFHGVDERVSVSGLAWGFPVLLDVVRRFCGPGAEGVGRPADSGLP